jgi:RND family efflux transporter MFP subunit
MNKTTRIAVQSVLVLVLIGAGIVGFKMLRESRQALGRQEVQVPLPLVRTVPVEFGEVPMTVNGEGTVRPWKQSQVVPQVSGTVTGVSPDLVDGGSFDEGETLLAIDKRDYEIAVTLAEAAVKDAESAYEMARQESEASRREWRQIHPGEEPPPLVAKEPQLFAAKANLEAQRANLARARLNLARTRITAPFDGRVSAEQVDIGQYVGPGQVLASIYATEAVEIVVPMESEDLDWFSVPGFTTDREKGAEAKIRARIAGRERVWTGRVQRVQGSVDERTRMFNVVIRVNDPFATRPPLTVGQYAEVEIKGDTLSEAALIPRAALRGENTVWAVNREDGRLHFRDVVIARKDERGVVVEEGLSRGDRVVVSPLKAATHGMRVRAVDARQDGLS